MDPTPTRRRKGGEAFDVPLAPAGRSAASGVALAARLAARRPTSPTALGRRRASANDGTAVGAETSPSSARRAPATAAPPAAAVGPAVGGSVAALGPAGRAARAAPAAVTRTAATGEKPRDAAAADAAAPEPQLLDAPAGSASPAKDGSVDSTGRAATTGAAASGSGGGRSAVVSRAGAESEDDEDEGTAGDDAWTYDPPPSAQGRWFFPIDGLLFDSKFDSGNLRFVERTGRMRYALHIAPDCAGTPRQTANRQWFHFAIYGGRRGDVVSLTLTSIPQTKMYTFGYSPCAAFPPLRPGFLRTGWKTVITKVESAAALGTPTSASSCGVTPLSFATDGSPRGAGGVGLGGGRVGSSAFGAPFETLDAAAAATPTTSTGEAKAGGASSQLIHLSFDATFEADSCLRTIACAAVASGTVSTAAVSSGAGEKQSVAALPADDPSSYAAGLVIANAHPYSYSRLQRTLQAWDLAINGTGTGTPQPPPPPCTSPDCGSGVLPQQQQEQQRPPLYLHRELLCRSLDRRRVDLITITGPLGPGASAKDTTGFEPMIEAEVSAGAPSDQPSATAATESFPPVPVPPSYDLAGPQLDGDFHPTPRPGNGHPRTNRARLFPNRRYVVLSARVHPGECPSSHVLHGALEFALSRTDPRAAAFRRDFVLVVVPMINPDGVARGHSRADTTGVNLNRRYKSPHRRRHPSIFALRQLLFQLQRTGRLALYVDLHGHANKKGVFFYGNALPAPEQVQNVLYAKLVSLNSPYFDFAGSNFSEQNMFAVGKNGEGKDGSSRVTLFQETGIVHCYTMEANYVTGNALNPVSALPSIPGEETGWIGGAPCPKYTVLCFHDVGRALLVSLLDLFQCNPHSRLGMTSHHNLRGLALWVQRVLLVDAWEQMRRQAVLRSGQSISRANAANAPGVNAAVDTGGSFGSEPSLAAILASPLPDVVTLRGQKLFPPTTTYNLRLLGRQDGKSERDGPVLTITSAGISASAAAALAASEREKALARAGAAAGLGAAASAPLVAAAAPVPAGTGVGGLRTMSSVPGRQTAAVASSAPARRSSSNAVGGSGVPSSQQAGDPRHRTAACAPTTTTTWSAPPKAAGVTQNSRALSLPDLTVGLRR